MSDNQSTVDTDAILRRLGPTVSYEEQDAAMQSLWSRFMATKPGPQFKPWDEMDAFERAIMKAMVVRELGDQDG